MPSYILEKQTRTPEGYIHVGYIMAVFASTNDAAKYYDASHIGYGKMRLYNRKNSDWCPITNSRYLIREYREEHLTLPLFTEVLTHPYSTVNLKNNKVTDNNKNSAPKKKVAKKACPKASSDESSNEASESE